MDLDTQGLDVVSPVGLFGEINEVDGDLVPSFIHGHGHRAGKRFDTGRSLKIICHKLPFDSFVI